MLRTKECGMLRLVEAWRVRKEKRIRAQLWVGSRSLESEE